MLQIIFILIPYFIGAYKAFVIHGFLIGLLVSLIGPAAVIYGYYNILQKLGLL